MDGARFYGVWARDFADGGICGEGVQQYSGRAATGVCVRECAAVCDVHARDVLETHDRARRVLGIARRNRSRGDALWIDTAGGSGRGSEGRISGDNPARLSERDGAEFLDGDFCVGWLLYADGGYFPTDCAAPGRGIERAGVFADGET